jgi:hypothetical protein
MQHTVREVKKRPSSKIWGLFNKTTKISDNHIIQYIMNWKGCGRKWSWHNLSYYPAFPWRDLGKPRDTCQDSSCHVRDSNWLSPHYKCYGLRKFVRRLWSKYNFFSLALQPQFGPWPTSMKLSVSVRFSRSYRTPWAGDQLVARPLPVHKHRKMHTYTQTLNIHALSGIRTHDPSFRASEGSACPRPLGYRDRRSKHNTQLRSKNDNVKRFYFESSQVSALVWIPEAVITCWLPRPIAYLRDGGLWAWATLNNEVLKQKPAPTPLLIRWKWKVARMRLSASPCQSVRIITPERL